MNITIQIQVNNVTKYYTTIKKEILKIFLLFRYLKMGARV